MRKLITSIIINIKLYYYTFLDYLEGLNVEVDVFSGERKIQQKANHKLRRGVKRINDFLRSLQPHERTSYENLIGINTAKKSASEKMAELRVKDKVNRNPNLKTEDDLVNKVVKEAPRYQLERDLSETRKAITACLRASSKDPSNPSYVVEMKALKAKSDRLRAEIERMKRNS